jgi:hypothetical protein
MLQSFIKDSLSLHRKNTSLNENITLDIPHILAEDNDKLMAVFT